MIEIMKDVRWQLQSIAEMQSALLFGTSGSSVDSCRPEKLHIR